MKNTLFSPHKKNGPSRRRFPRIPYVGALKIIVQEGIAFTEQIKNISLKGLSISHSGKYKFNLYEKFPFEITLSELNPESNIRGAAQIIRMVPYEEIGLSISSIDERNQAKLGQFIDKVLHKH